MAIKTAVPTRTEIYVRAGAKAYTSLKPKEEIPSGLYPLRMAAYDFDEYRLLAGWPVPIPPYNIHAITDISASGEVLAFRPENREITTNALVRWIADDDTYDTDTLLWHPWQQQVNLTWETGVGFAPTYTEGYEYRVGRERFYGNTLNFDSDSREHFWMDMSSVLGGAGGYTVVMVGALNSVYGNNLDVPYNGIWGPGYAPGVDDTFDEPVSGGWIAVTLQGGYLFVESDQAPRKRALPVAHLLAKSAPTYLALVLGYPTSTLYAGAGPSSIISGTVQTGEQAAPLSNQVVLGRTNGDVLHTADMGLMDIGIYGEQLSALQVQGEFAKLSGVYGGDK